MVTRFFPTELHSYDSFGHLIRSAGYDHVADEVQEKNFPFKPRDAVCNLGLVDCSSLGTEVTTEAVLSYFDTLLVQPATSHEILAFGRQHPYFRDWYPGYLNVIALGSKGYFHNEHWNVLAMPTYGSGRSLTIMPYDATRRAAWLSQRYRFLVSA